jgi:hypothetical protein
MKLKLSADSRRELEAVHDKLRSVLNKRNPTLPFADFLAASTTLHRVLILVQEQLICEGAKIFSQFFQNEARARIAFSQSDTVTIFSRRLTMLTVGCVESTACEGEIKSLAELIEKTLCGENPFEVRRT